ncbi:MAG TPA: hypothetical protein VLK22_02795 [Candidatus Udaeobacter sp.]|nr:hypothetical protein [Candidatus Udaeobacter sp.]
MSVKWEAPPDGRKWEIHQLQGVIARQVIIDYSWPILNWWILKKINRWLMKPAIIISIDAEDLFIFNQIVIEVEPSFPFGIEGRIMVQLENEGWFEKFPEGTKVKVSLGMPKGWETIFTNSYSIEVLQVEPLPDPQSELLVINEF